MATDLGDDCTSKLQASSDTEKNNSWLMESHLIWIVQWFVLWLGSFSWTLFHHLPLIRLWDQLQGFVVQGSDILHRGYNQMCMITVTSASMTRSQDMRQCLVKT